MSQTLRSILKTVKPRTFGPEGINRRLISPNYEGKLLKPFVLLDVLKGPFPRDSITFGFHPHSGIATLSYQKDFPLNYTDTEGRTGVLPPGGLEWMRAGGGAWHRGDLVGQEGKNTTGFQLWISLPPGVEDGPSHSEFVAPERVPAVENVKVLMGKYKNAVSPIKDAGSENITCLDVSVDAGGVFEYDFPEGQTASWVLVYDGMARINGMVPFDDHLMILSGEKGGSRLHVVADEDEGVKMIIGSAVPQKEAVVTSFYSVHTNKASLAAGEKRILEIGSRLVEEGKITENARL
ncbi:hypothetical protein BCR33DRAFT_857132 [Rhizoclosmatium globosum]|uniref:Pirin N-terminal domain-containing protein n=1 Tax=Rhizoclosmatium globosum TaxID=329046 RepID=A0A1Y2B8M8_9FUNG|nr:hypothetical protein BCR33DRAFT_857132 [Rhizoclosmatium globosum]|eukprot:ORY31179.1 hypothetical protein BCR33DRAFT_857132 [Rhizoclosmatium globosum]